VLLEKILQRFPGCQRTPWRTIARVNATSLSPGDTVAFDGGSTFAGNLLIARSGTIRAPIVVTSYPSIVGTRAEIFAGLGDGIVVENAEYVRVENLRVVGGGISNNNGYGIKVNRTVAGSERLHSIYIDHVEASGFRMTGIALHAGSDVAVGYDDVRITNSDIHGNGYAGHNVIHDNPGIDIYEQTGNGLFFKDVDGRPAGAQWWPCGDFPAAP
jgi:hypothetical protein